MISELLIAGSQVLMKVVADHIKLIIRDGKVPEDWKESYIISLYKQNGDALSRGNYGDPCF